MKRAASLACVGVVVLFAATDAQAGGPWDHSGGTEGRFGSAIEACKDQLGTGGAYEVVEATPADANGYSTCMVKQKGGNGGEKLANGLVYLVGPQPAPAPSSPGGAAPATPTASSSGVPASPPASSGCDENTDLRWFPSMAKSRLASFASGDSGNVSAYAKPGACGDATKSVGGRIFGNSKGRVKPDRWGTDRKLPDHYFLRVGDLIVDSTLFQFFNVKEGFNGAVFVGTEAQLTSTLNRLARQCGTSQDERLKKVLVGKSGKDLKAGLWDNAVLKNSGETLGPSGRKGEFEYKTR